MILKELKRTVNVCWSPAEHYPVMLATGSAAQQVDASFSSSSYLELYSLNLEDPGLDLELKSSLQTQQKFHKIVWSGTEVIVGGCDGGLMQFYSSEKLLNNASDSLLGTSNKHSGNVSSLDINPYQKNLLASGASDSEIFIWDLNNTSQPMAPGNRSQPYDHVQALAWNQQVQHILGSTFATRCVVWDLRKNEPIMKLSDSQSRSRWRSLAWHPAVATQLCVASEDDQVPVIQLWDLRLAASPLATLQAHAAGVMSVSWSRRDPDLLLSGGKDGRLLCWNPNNTSPGGELLAELSNQQQWVFETAWCPRDPSLLVAASFDQRLAVHSLLGGSKPETSTGAASNILESFGGETFRQLPAVQRAPAAAAAAPCLPRAPRWLRRPAAAGFGFGGKLVTFENCPQEANSQRLVYISQVVSEPELVEQSVELDEVLNSALSAEPDAVDKLAEYCRARSAGAQAQERRAWQLLRAHFLPPAAFRAEVLHLLGFKQDETPSKLKTANANEAFPQSDPSGLSRGESTETEAELSTDTSTDLSDAHTLIEKKLADLDIEPNVTNVVIPNGEDSTSLICRALVCGNIEEAVDLCLEAKRISDALIIASLGGEELTRRVQRQQLALAAREPVALLAGAVLARRWDRLVRAADLACWRHTLAALLTHCDDAARPHYCELLGDKLAESSDPSLAEAATICYLVAMSPDILISRWTRGKDHAQMNRDLAQLTKVTSLALLTRRAALHRDRPIQDGGAVEAAVRAYAGRLAAQGCLRAALRALLAAPTAAAELRGRLQGALQQQEQLQQQQQQQQQQHQQYNRTRTISNQSQHKAPYPGHNYTPYNQAEQRYDQWNQPSKNTWAAPQPPAPPAAPAPAAPPQQQPPRPGSVGPQGGLASRSKYKVDPSVQSSQNYNQYGFNPLASQQSYGYNSPLPDQYQNSSVPNSFAPINPNPGLNPLNPANPGINPLNPTVNPLNPAVNPLNPAINPLNPTVNPLNPLNPNQTPLNPVAPAVNGSYYSPAAVEPAAAAPGKPMQAGWNDPPMPSAKTKPKQEVQAQAPITHPLFGAEPPQHVPLVPGQYPGQQPQYPGQQSQYPGQYPAQQQYPGQYDQYQQGYNQAPTQLYHQQPEPAPAPAAEPPAAAPKPPLPEQFQFLQDTFDRIRADCAERARNPQMKRKLEDVQRRLENLYDSLREQRLSESAAQTLQQTAQLAQQRAYSAATGACTALASGADFAAAASFLPGLKVLFQLADQLQLHAG